MLCCKICLGPEWGQNYPEQLATATPKRLKER